MKKQLFMSYLEKQNDVPDAGVKRYPPIVCLKRLWGFLRPYWGWLLPALLFTLIQTAATLYIPVVIGDAVDAIVGVNDTDFAKITASARLLAGLIFVVFAFRFFSTLCTNRLSFCAIRDLRNAMFDKLNAVPVSYIDTNSHGDIMSRIVNDADMISDGLIQGFTQLFAGVVTVAGTVVFMFALNALIAAIVAVLTPLSIFVAWFIAKRSHNMFRRQAEARGKMSGLCEELIGGQKVVKAFSYEERAEERFEQINAELQKYGVGAMFFSSITNPSTRFVNGIVYAAVAVAGGLIVMANPLAFTVGNLSSFLSYANQYSKPFNEITGVVTELQAAFSSLRRCLQVVDEQEEPSDADLPALEKCDGTVTAEHVSFSYDKTRRLIRDFNISVANGQKIAIVGPTGCGKTTLINLLMRFYDPDGGRITVSGKAIDSVKRASLRACYGMVLQDSRLFYGTIAENIAYGKEDATLAEIEAAAKRARIHRFIMTTKDGYNTLISEDGANISAGQKQLLCIARVMLAMPPMLILDEATSSIDTRTERRITAAFAEMTEGRTSFVIAHRLSTIMDADVILVMNDGDIIESGAHAELLAKNGFYARLYNSQFAAPLENP
ncbi:MAG: ABC transporter ATP-binding protein/permease [Clostridiales bacterium]|jgi:ATP-binding cassette subfamily B protein|nr:ABC transporter ATP-binding protein/permease [Clostridiales bacterium]